MPMPLGERGPRRIRLWEETRPRLGRETIASGTRDDCVWDERRLRLGYETDESGTAFADKLGYRICDLCFLGGR